MNRLFIATFIEDKVFFDHLSIYINGFTTNNNLKVKWVKPSHIHLTWKFLGDVQNSDIEIVINSIEKAVKGFKSSVITFNSLEIWPKPSSPRQIVLTGVDSNNNISQNFNILDNNLFNIGFNKEKRSFRPHLTLGRFKLNTKLESPLKLMSDSSLFIEPFEVSKIELVKSILLPQGPEYTSIQSFIV